MKKVLLMFCEKQNSPPPDRGDIGGEILFEVDERNFDGLSGLHKGRPKNSHN